jgi:LemA protein
MARLEWTYTFCLFLPTMWTFLSILLVFVLAFVPTAGVIVIYNGLIRQKNEVENAYGSIDTLLKKRCDLIPNLVSTVQQAMNFEKSILTEISRLRSQVLASRFDAERRMPLENQLSQAMTTLIGTIEAYPDLKANRNLLHLQGTLLEIEEQISAARRFYNRAVTDYNNGIEMFPSNMIASAMRYGRKTVFEASESDRNNVNVSQLFTP